MAKSERTTVWLIEDNAAYRGAVARAIDSAPHLVCPRQFTTCEEALDALGDGLTPDVVLLDVGLPGMSGLDGIGRIRELAPQTQIVVLTVFEDDEKIVRAICAGAAGYLLKVSPVEQITAAIDEVRRGGSPMSARVARRMLQKFTELSAPPGDYGLSERERQILDLLVRGHIKKEIAKELALSVHTVDSHLRNIYEKLHVNTRAGAVAKAVRERLV
jgi:DNA-binding NarL/FixJ family response regulator